MRLTRFVDYGVCTLAHLGESPNRRASVREIAAMHGLSPHHLGKVVHALGKAGYVRTIRGKGGGLELARSPDRITLGEVVRRLEPKPGAYPLAGAMEAALVDATDAFLLVLDDYTISDVLQPLQRQAGDDARGRRPAPGSVAAGLRAGRAVRPARPAEDRQGAPHSR